MILILSSTFDAASAGQAQERAGLGGRVLTPADLARPGWRVGPGAGQWSRHRAVANGEVVPCESIDAVLTRLPMVAGQELVTMRPTDREYAATEMSMFLLAWLSDLVSRGVPVVNAPTVRCLCGPSWRPAQWVHAAARLGLAVRPIRMGDAEVGPVLPDSTAAGSLVTVAGRRAFGLTAPGGLRELDDEKDGSGESTGQADAALRLARAAGVDLLDVAFDSAAPTARIISATTMIDLSRQIVRDAVRDLLVSRAADRLIRTAIASGTRAVDRADRNLRRAGATA